MATAQSIAARESFIEAMKSAGLTSPVTRADVKALCLATGIYACPPAWISQDQSRRTGTNGEYLIPELDGGAAPAKKTAKVKKAIAKPVQGNPTPAPSVATSEIRGLTGGESDSLVPSKISTYVPWGHFGDIETIIKSGMFYPMFVTGLSGNGKTTMIEQVCAKLKREMFRVNITKQTDEDDLLGGFRLINGETVWCDGPVVRAMKQGGILLLDEIDLASHNIMCLQPVLEGKGVFLKKIGQWVTPAAGFQIFATANTKGKGSDDGRFVGTNVLNEAFLDRFSVTLEQEYAPKTTELRIVKKKMEGVGKTDEEFAKMLVDWADMIRKCFYQDAVDEIITTRRLLDIVTAYSIFGDRKKSIEMAITRFDSATKESFLTMYSKLDEKVADAIADENSVSEADARLVGIKVPYESKDSVKRMGAKWDPASKNWIMDIDQYKDNKTNIANHGWDVTFIKE